MTTARPGPGGDLRRPGRSGCAQRGDRRGVPRPGAVAVADRRPRCPPRDLPRLLPPARRATRWPRGWCTPPPDATPWRCGCPPGPGPPARWPGYRQRLAAATAPWTGRFAVFDQALEAHHPAGVPHQHLAILAVRPGRQGRGIGTALLTARHRDLDRDGVPAYLEASSPRARDLYLRHGYTARPGSAFRLPEGRCCGPCGANRRWTSSTGKACENDGGCQQPSLPRKPAPRLRQLSRSAVGYQIEGGYQSGQEIGAQ